MPSGDRNDNIRVSLRYALMQLPGLVLVVMALLATSYFVDMPLWVAVAVIAGWMAKDLAMYPFLKHAYSGGIGGGASSLSGLSGMSGMKGKVLSTLSPDGSVKVRGEIWQARPEGQGTVIECGRPVRVKGINGMTLLVEPCPDDEQAVEDKKASK